MKNFKKFTFLKESKQILNSNVFEKLGLYNFENKRQVLKYLENNVGFIFQKICFSIKKKRTRSKTINKYSIYIFFSCRFTDFSLS